MFFFFGLTSIEHVMTGTDITKHEILINELSVILAHSTCNDIFDEQHCDREGALISSDFVEMKENGVIKSDETNLEQTENVDSNMTMGLSS